MSFLHYREGLLFFILQLVIVNGSGDFKRYPVNIQLDEFNGTIVGKEMYDWMNETFIGFLGIPYAKAPLNDLRFRDPQKLDNFNGTYEAFYDGYECPSITALNQSEDCLYLNVYTKNISRSLPVLIAIHPGGLYIQSGASYFMKPNYLLTKNIVLVTFNYRLGTLGYLNLGTKSIPGNAGLKDQVFALRWVKKFIAYFGGDPDNVTLMGYSAGALSVSLHLVSPMSQNLFSKAIIMSGSLPPQTQLPQGEQRSLAIRQANILHCSFTERNYSNAGEDLESNLLSCFKKYQGYQIANTLRKMFDFGKDNPIYLWLPIIENDFQQERFLDQDFYTTLLKQPKYIKVNSLLIGYTNGEFCESAANILLNSSLIEILQNNYEFYFPKIFMYENKENFRYEYTKKIIQHYLSKDLHLLRSDDYDNLCDLFSDSLIRFGAHRLAELLSNHISVYLYEFTYSPNQYQHGENFPNRKVRVEHMNDFHYLFNDIPKHLLKPEVTNIVNTYLQFIYDFITNGNLTSNYAKTYPQNYAYIDGIGITYKTGHNNENLQFWTNLFTK